MAGEWHVEADRKTCMGSGVCRGIVPGLFVAADDGKTIVTHDTVPADEQILDAADVCPAEAITVTDAGTGEVLAPRE